MIAIGEARVLGIGNIDFVVGSIEGLPVQDESFDAVMAHSILHLVDNRDGIFEKSYRALKSGGVFITSSVCLGESFKLKLLSYLFVPFSLMGLLPRLYLFSGNELLGSIKQAGFDIDYQWRPDGQGSIVKFIVEKKR